MLRRNVVQGLLFALALLCLLVFSGVVSGQGRSDEAFERVKEVQQRHIDVLMDRLGVVGVGIGYNDDGELAIKVFTESSDVPGIPRALENVRVETVISGQFVARADPTARFDRPVPIGVSTGHPMITAGTIGCRVTDGTDIYALSNNHVYANSNSAQIDDVVIQPGTYDGGTLDDEIGKLAAFKTIYFDGTSNYIDAAIALCSTATLGTATPSDGYGTPSSTVAEAQLRMRVKKYGRTTGLTAGRIDALNATVNVSYGTSGTARFVGQIIISPARFSAGGDSGSLIVTESGNNPVGLLFAGSTLYTIANPIGVVLSTFGVAVDASSEDPPSENQPPVANFTYDRDGLTVTFTDASTDSDGSVVGWAWTFGDGGTSTEQNPTYTYAAGGTYSVSLTVTDNDGAKDTASKPITVAEQQEVTYDVEIVESGTIVRYAGKNAFVRAYAIVSVTDGTYAAPEAFVTADWSGAVTGESSGYTDASGEVALYSPEIKTKSSVAFNLAVSSVDGYEVTGVNESITYEMP